MDDGEKEVSGHPEGMGSNVIWRQPGLFRDPRQHPRPDFVIVVEGKDVVGPADALRNAVRTSNMPLD